MARPLDGIRAVLLSEINATPEGSDRTPAPIIFLARLNVEVDSVAWPPDSASVAAADITGFDDPYFATLVARSALSLLCWIPNADDIPNTITNATYNSKSDLISPAV